MAWLKFGFVCLLLLTLSKWAGADIGSDCSANGNTDCAPVNNEVCDTGATDLCICDAGNSFVVDPSNAAVCLKDCQTPVNPTGYTLTAGGGATDTLEGATATVACATGYQGTPSPAAVACTKSGWANPSGCTVVDCGEPLSQAGYSATKDGGTTYDETATVTCDTGNGYSGTPPKISCRSDGSWTAYTGCSQSGGGVDCGIPAASTGYIPGTPGTTAEGGTASVSCDTANGYTGTAASITCQADGTWTDYSGCSASGNGASEIRQTFSFVILIGSLIIALIYI